MKKYFLPVVLTATMLTMAACSESELSEGLNPDVDRSNKIAFTSSAEGGTAPTTQSRAGFTGGAEFSGILDKPTQLVVRMSSFNGSETRHTKTLMTAQPEDPNGTPGQNMNLISTVDYVSGNNRYWDDAWGRAAQLSVYAVAVPNYEASVYNPAGSSSESNKLYEKVQKGTSNASTFNSDWQNDDETDELNSIAWEVSTVQTDGYTGTIAKEDLCYSHNIQATTDAVGELQYGKGKDGVREWNGTGYNDYSYSAGGTDHYPTLDDGCMKFKLEDPSQLDGPGHFDKGHMIFRHALTRITVNLKKSTGFTAADLSDFVLTADNVVLLNMPYLSTFNFKTGKWGTSTPTPTISTAKRTTAAAGADYTTFAQVIPNFELVNGATTTNVMKFTVSDNTYFVTSDQLFDALNLPDNTNHSDINGNKLVTVNDNKIALEQGKNYIFTITVKKKGIEVTASVVPWIEVEGSAEARNDYVKIDIADEQSEKSTHFDLYRLNDDVSDIYAPETGPGTGTNWEKRYNWYGDYKDDAHQKANKTWNSTKNVWETEWFWETNKTFYHFRTVNEGLSIQGSSDAGVKDYFNVYGGAIEDYDDVSATPNNSIYNGSTGRVNDYRWGAPFKNGASQKYDVNYGWSAANDADGQIYPAIGSTSDKINLIEHHMMSNIYVILKTTENSDASNHYLANNSVNIKNATIKLTQFYNEGTVLMGTGLVKVTGALTPAATITAPAYDNFFKTADKWTESNPYSYRVVPQILYRGSEANPDNDNNRSNFIGLEITTQTPDDNQYYVIKDLSKIKVTNAQPSNSNHVQNKEINRWYPGHKYIYTITISKKGIEAITCTVVDWITVYGDNIDIDLEK